MMKVKHSFLVFAAAFLMVMPAFAKTGVVYQRQDSLRIVSLLQQAKAMKKKPANWMMWLGRQFVGWLTNMRARDLPCTPLAVAYALVTMDSCTLFIAPGRLNDADAKTLADNGVSLRDYPELIDVAKDAFLACDVEPQVLPIRGGTDGAQLSFRGLPCPNLSTGGYCYHGVNEFVPVSSLVKMTDVLQELVARFA